MDHRKTGRTTRMLEHAAAKAKYGKLVTIYGNDHKHTETLAARFTELYGKTKRSRNSKWYNRVAFASFSAIDGTNPYPSIREWQWHQARLQLDGGNLHLVDHYALEQRLNRIVDYLDGAKHLQTSKQVVEWMAVTAKLLSATGRAMYLVVDDATVREALQLEVEYRHAAIESGFGLGLNWLQLRAPKMHPNCVVLFDPVFLREMFGASIKEAQRWNA
jgi:hypothetical protein